MVFQTEFEIAIRDPSESSGNLYEVVAAMLEEVIDGLTNSVVEVATGRKYATKISGLDVADILSLRQEGWRFDWVRQLGAGEVYGLRIPKAGQAIHGLMSLSRKDGFIELHLLESHPENVGRSKKFRGVAGNLVAYAARVAFELGFKGHVAFEAKTELIAHYERSLGARRIRGSQRMYLDRAAAEKLVAQYFGGSHGTDL